MFEVGLHRSHEGFHARDAVLYYADSADEAVAWARTHVDCLDKINHDSVLVVQGQGAERIHITRDGQVLAQIP